MVGPRLIIEPNGVYDDVLLRSTLDVSADALTSARRCGRLRFTRKGRRVLYLGQWIIDWLSSESATEGGPTHAA